MVPSQSGITGTRPSSSQRQRNLPCTECNQRGRWRKNQTWQAIAIGISAANDRFVPSSTHGVIRIRPADSSARSTRPCARSRISGMLPSRVATNQSPAPTSSATIGRQKANAGVR